MLQQFLGSCNLCNCNCCARIEGDDDEDLVSENGFNKEAAQTYMAALKASYQFGLADSVIGPLLKREFVTSRAEYEEVEDVVVKSPNAAPPNGGAEVHFSITQVENPS